MLISPLCASSRTAAPAARTGRCWCCSAGGRGVARVEIVGSQVGVEAADLVADEQALVDHGPCADGRDRDGRVALHDALAGWRACVEGMRRRSRRPTTIAWRITGVSPTDRPATAPVDRAPASRPVMPVRARRLLDEPRAAASAARKHMATATGVAGPRQRRPRPGAGRGSATRSGWRCRRRRRCGRPPRGRRDGRARREPRGPSARCGGQRPSRSATKPTPQASCSSRVVERDVDRLRRPDGHRPGLRPLHVAGAAGAGLRGFCARDHAVLRHVHESRA